MRLLTVGIEPPKSKSHQRYTHPHMDERQGNQGPIKLGSQHVNKHIYYLYVMNSPDDGKGGNITLT